MSAESYAETRMIMRHLLAMTLILLVGAITCSYSELRLVKGALEQCEDARTQEGRR